MNARAFGCWLAEQSLPTELHKKAHRALRALLVIDRPDNRHETAQRLHRETLREFAEAYAGHRA